MHDRRSAFYAPFDRRQFGGWFVAFFVGTFFSKLPLRAAQSSEFPVGEAKYLVVNGWVLTREDVATMELPPDVIRLQ